MEKNKYFNCIEWIDHDLIIGRSKILNSVIQAGLCTLAYINTDIKPHVKCYTQNYIISS